MNKCFFIVVLFLGAMSMVRSQDVQYSQFYSNPLYLNPAFAGTSGNQRLSLSFRDQWPSVTGAYISYSLGYDIDVRDYNSGLGFTASHDQAGSGGLGTTELGMDYAYNIQLNRNVSLRPAIGVKYANQSVDVTKLTFGDQLITGNSVSVQPNIENTSTSYIDLNAGALLYGKDFWLGYSIYHINEPDNSLVTGQVNKISARQSIHAGYRFPLVTGRRNEVTRSFSLALHLKKQGEWSQLDIGGYYYEKPFQVGIWYRGIPRPGEYNTGFQNSDAIILMAGIEYNQVKFMYSYDITISDIYSNTGGSHELTLVFDIRASKKGRKRFSQLACPQF